MWRKQDEPKAPANPIETSPSQQVASPAPVTPAVAAVAPIVPVAPVSAVRLAPIAPTTAGHIAKGLIVKGEITGRDDLLIEGEVHGQIRMADGRVTIGPGGRVVACIEAREIVLRGKVKGDLRATENVHIGNTGSLIGDAVTPRIAIDEGAELRGNLDTTRAGDRQAARAASAAGSATSNPHPSNPNNPVETRPVSRPAVQTKESVPGA